MKYLKITLGLMITALSFAGCSKDYPVDEDGLLITTRRECYVSSFELLGTDLKNLYPQFSLATDCKLDPKITGKVDFSDLANPKKWTVVSGDRQIRKEYTVFVTVQP